MLASMPLSTSVRSTTTTVCRLGTRNLCLVRPRAVWRGQSSHAHLNTRPPAPIGALALHLVRRSIHTSAAVSSVPPQTGTGSGTAAAAAAMYFPGALKTPSSNTAGAGSGSVLRVTQAEPGLWIIAFTGAETEDNRLTPYFLSAYLEALDYVAAEWVARTVTDRAHDGGAVVTTGQTHRGAKFFSNGLDYELAMATPWFFDWPFGATLQRLLTFPLPTVAALGGHTFAGAFALAMAHDYRVMNSQRGFMCLNEILFGARIPGSMSALLRAKIADPRVLRKAVFEAHRFAGQEAFNAGLVDYLVPSPDTSVAPADIPDIPRAVLAKAIDLARQLRPLAAHGSYGANRGLHYVDTLAQINMKYVPNTPLLS